MKMDKETLVKHQFWLLLGASGVLTLAALVLLFLGPRSKAALARKNFNTAKDTLGPKAPKDPKNGNFLKPWNKRRDYFTDHKNVVWKQAWEPQKDMMAWPRGFPPREKLENGYFGDDIPDNQRLAYKETYYANQFTPEAFFAPDATEAGVYFPVTFDRAKIFGRRDWGKTVPTVEECWLAQEDIWVRREILKVLQGALRAMGHFNAVRQPLWKDAVSAVGGATLDALVRRDPRARVHQEFTNVRLAASNPLDPEKFLARTLPVPGKEQLKGIVRSLLFRSHNWEVNLLLEKKPNTVDSLQISRLSTIKNINPAGRALALNNGGRPRVLLLKREGSRGIIRLQGELLRWGQHADFKESILPSSFDFSSDFDLEEEFNTLTSPIKALETLVLGKEAIYHRFEAGGFEMQKGRLTPKPKEPAENAEGQGQDQGNPMPGGPPGPGGGQSPGPGAMNPPGQGQGTKGQGAKTDEDLTPSGINRVRYVLSKEIEPVRRIPVAFTIIVDQAFRNEVLAAMANSRLRIQTTQVYWAHRDYRPLKGNDVVGGFGPQHFMPGGREGMPVGPKPPFGPGTLQRPPMGSPPPGVGVPPMGSPPPGVGVPPMGSPPSGVGVPPMGSPPPGVGVPPMPGGMPGEGAAAQPADNSALGDHNLIELTVHGVAALFERYPARKKPAEGENTTTTDTTK